MSSKHSHIQKYQIFDDHGYINLNSTTNNFVQKMETDNKRNGDGETKSYLPLVLFSTANC